ncbi:hypothetical protein Pcinc_028839 [Petrolisthes cinctipes]|uniref:Uncharacterized protein n=1 Tax=Petrolisthes cinctipes TaxID=88211 RepID=A0AAE1F188_PETCI|nr:hypothetical protein Pcinc_028839 [Petrolisthes cinctipes]
MLWTWDKGVGVVLCVVCSYVGALLLHALSLATFTYAHLALCLLSVLCYLYRASREVDVRGRVVLITGCDSGFGLALALHLHKLGVVVVAGVLKEDSEGAKQLKKEQGSTPSIHVVPFDVTSPQQLSQAAQTLAQLLPPEGLWGLVNNAGVCSLGPVEWLGFDTFRRDTEVNLFGLVAATKTFLPFVRRAKGRVVSVASVAGRVSCGFLGAYSASKYAVEGFNDALRHEMRPFGVKVALVEPGNFANGTRLFATDEVVEREVAGLWDALSEDLKHDYGNPYCKKIEGFMKNFRRTGARDISPVVNALTEALTQEHPQARYCPMNPLGHVVAWIATHLPEAVYDSMVALLSRLMLESDEV